MVLTTPAPIELKMSAENDSDLVCDNSVSLDQLQKLQSH